MIYLYNFFKPISSSKKKHSKHIDLQKKLLTKAIRLNATKNRNIFLNLIDTSKIMSFLYKAQT